MFVPGVLKLNAGDQAQLQDPVPAAPRAHEPRGRLHGHLAAEAVVTPGHLWRPAHRETIFRSYFW